MCDLFFFSSRRRHTRLQGDWSSDVCSSDLAEEQGHTVGRLAAAVHDLLVLFHEAEAIDLLVHEEIRVADTRHEIGRASCRERVGREGRAAAMTKQRKAMKEILKREDCGRAR